MLAGVRLIEAWDLVLVHHNITRLKMVTEFFYHEYAFKLPTYPIMEKAALS
jgi:hypothetical protein